MFVCFQVQGQNHVVLVHPRQGCRCILPRLRCSGSVSRAGAACRQPASSGASCLCSQGGRQLPSRPLRSRLEKLAITCPAGAGALSPPALVLPGDALQHPAWFWFWRILPGLCFIARNSALEIAHFFVHFCITNREQFFDIAVISLYTFFTFFPREFSALLFFMWSQLGIFSAGNIF